MKPERGKIQRQPAATADQIPRQKYRSERECRELARGHAAHSKLGQAGKAETKRAADDDLNDGRTDQGR